MLQSSRLRIKVGPDRTHRAVYGKRNSGLLHLARYGSKGRRHVSTCQEQSRRMRGFVGGGRALYKTRTAEKTTSTFSRHKKNHGLYYVLHESMVGRHRRKARQRASRDGTLLIKRGWHPIRRAKKNIAPKEMRSVNLVE